MIIGRSYNGYWISHDINTPYYIVSIGSHDLYYAFTSQEALDYIDGR